MKARKIITISTTCCISALSALGLAACGGGTGGDSTTAATTASATAATTAATTASTTAATTASGGSSSGAIEVTDHRGKTVTFDKPAEKIVCLLNSGLNDLEMLGAADGVVGIDEWTYTNDVTYSVLSKVDERIGKKEIPAVDNNMETIISLEPDVVIIWAQDDEKINTLESNGIKVIGIQCDNFDDVDSKMEIIAKTVGKEDRAKEILSARDELLKEVTNVTDGISDSERKSGIFVWGSTMLDLAGSTSTGDTTLKQAGMTNAASGINEEHFVAKMEDVISWNPQVIAMWNIADLNPEDYYKDSQWADIDAVKNKEVYEIPDDMTFYSALWTVKYIYGAAYFAKNAYPDKFADFDLDKFRSEMMQKYYGKTVE